MLRSSWAPGASCPVLSCQCEEINCIETRAQSRSVMLLKCSGLHAHYTDSANELLLRAFSDVSLAAWSEGIGESFETES